MKWKIEQRILHELVYRLRDTVLPHRASFIRDLVADTLSDEFLLVLIHRRPVSLSRANLGAFARYFQFDLVILAVVAEAWRIIPEHVEVAHLVSY
jgi:hypothetical protein